MLFFPRLHEIAFKLWAHKTKNEHWGTSNPAFAYKKLAEMLQEWTYTVHDRLYRIEDCLGFVSKLKIDSGVILKIENVLKWSSNRKSQSGNWSTFSLWPYV